MPLLATAVVGRLIRCHGDATPRGLPLGFRRYLTVHQGTRGPRCSASGRCQTSGLCTYTIMLKRGGTTAGHNNAEQGWE